MQPLGLLGLIFVFSIAGICLAGRLRRWDSLLSAFMAGGFLGAAFGHLFILYDWKFWLFGPTLAFLAGPSGFLSRPQNFGTKVFPSVSALLVLNGLHSMLGAAAATAVNFRVSWWPGAAVVFALHELVHKAALVSWLRAEGCSGRKATWLACASTVATFGAWGVWSFPHSMLDLLEAVSLLGLAWMGLRHLRRHLPESRAEGLRFWPPVAAGFFIFAFWQ